MIILVKSGCIHGNNGHTDSVGRPGHRAYIHDAAHELTACRRYLKTAREEDEGFSAGHDLLTLDNGGEFRQGPVVAAFPIDVQEFQQLYPMAASRCQ